MPRPGEKTKNKKYKRTPSKTKTEYAKAKPSKHSCGLCKKEMHGVPNSKSPAKVKKMPKTARRPSGMFGGLLCTKCRAKVFEEAAKVESGAKKLEDVSYAEKPFIVQALERRK